MRISTQQLFNRGINNIQDVNEQLQKTQLQISSGKRVQRPSDDPVASTRILQINQDLDLIAQYKRNIDLAENRLRQEDQLLDGINDVVIRIRELTIQAGDGAQNADDKLYIAAEVKERLAQLAGFMNSQDPSGEFVFAGFQGNNAPFVQNESGAYYYQGDEGQRFLQVDTSVKVSSGDNGKALFVDIPAAENTFATRANPRNTSDPAAVISTGLMIDQELYDEYYPGDMVVTFNTNPALVTPPGPNFTITDRDSGKVIFNPQPYVSGQPIQANGVQFEIVGTPAAGDSFLVESREKQSLLTTTEKLIYGLENFQETGEGRQILDALIQDTLANLDSAQTAILETRGNVGARLNTIETTREMHLDVEVLTKEVLSDLQDVDFAEATSNLSLQSFILDAAYGTFTRVTGLSLFDQL
ncbi:flagellar hook-associated protein FlgL [Oleiphilus messinensis]|uniref:Flagellar hook-associated protein FlgL n=1 Tax=Oleiphilus messinensis TaxID=141451 RepID=A0A1Y0I9A2_9GAMM|nr:flagellar hook-associated protein FlgL [Oleiphilus messinensis]ARU57097.1 flagellar hook-associated protein FlgL [Oleiphilus messinensis]